MRGHDDESQDKKLFGKMLKKAMPHQKVAKHLKKDIGEQRRAIKEDKSLMKSIKPRKKSASY